MGVWRDMSSAPRDGRPIVARNWRGWTVRWFAGTWRRVPGGQKEPPKEWLDDEPNPCPHCGGSGRAKATDPDDKPMTKMDTWDIDRRLPGYFPW